MSFEVDRSWTREMPDVFLDLCQEYEIVTASQARALALALLDVPTSERRVDTAVLREVILCLDAVAAPEPAGADHRVPTPIGGVAIPKSGLRRTEDGEMDWTELDQAARDITRSDEGHDD